MSFDPSRAIYAHPICNNLPCTCEREHKPLENIITFYCNLCSFYGETVNQLQEHHIDRHSFDVNSIHSNGVKA